MAEMNINDAVVTTRLDAVVNWGRKNSLWPLPFGTACCAIEFMSMMASKYDLSRFGAEAMRFSPRQSDMMLVLGTVTNKMAPVLRTIYAQMAEPKWVISVGVCASSGGMYRTYATLQGMDRVIPVDVYVPGCPPRPESMIYGVMKLQEKIEKESLSMRKDHIARFYESLARQEALQAETGPHGPADHPQHADGCRRARRGHDLLGGADHDHRAHRRTAAGRRHGSPRFPGRPDHRGGEGEPPGPGGPAPPRGLPVPGGHHGGGLARAGAAVRRGLPLAQPGQPGAPAGEGARGRRRDRAHPGGPRSRPPTGSSARSSTSSASASKGTRT